MRSLDINKATKAKAISAVIFKDEQPMFEAEILPLKKEFRSMIAYTKAGNPPWDWVRKDFRK